MTLQAARRNPRSGRWSDNPAPKNLNRAARSCPRPPLVNFNCTSARPITAFDARWIHGTACRVSSYGCRALPCRWCGRAARDPLENRAKRAEPLGEGINMYPTHKACGHLGRLFFIPIGVAGWGLKFHLIQRPRGWTALAPAAQRNDVRKQARTWQFACTAICASAGGTDRGGFFGGQA